MLREDTSGCFDNGCGGTCHVTPSALGPNIEITVINGIFGNICIARLGGRAGGAQGHDLGEERGMRQVARGKRT